MDDGSVYRKTYSTGSINDAATMLATNDDCTMRLDTAADFIVRENNQYYYSVKGNRARIDGALFEKGIFKILSEVPTMAISGAIMLRVD
jgi:predicted transcriptional regulator YheO